MPRTFFAAGSSAVASSPVDRFFTGLRAAGFGASSFLGCAAMRDDRRVSAISRVGCSPGLGVCVRRRTVRRTNAQEMRTRVRATRRDAYSASFGLLGQLGPADSSCSSHYATGTEVRMLQRGTGQSNDAAGENRAGVHCAEVHGWIHTR